jgi:cobalt/nickel transport system permease protein
MHMADALLSPAVGGTMWAASAASLGLAVTMIAGKKNQAAGPAAGFDDRKIPLMGIMGAFVFAAQMINFTIPGTGSSGHIGGGILLAAMIGPWPALLVMASVLLIQCLFFADGGLLAWGCNVFNMGFIPAVLAYGCIFKPIVQKGLRKKRIFAASLAAVVIGLQAGAFAVVLETMLSGVTGLPLGVFLLLMQPIHLAIGLGEGLITAAVLCYVQSARPELLESAVENVRIPPAIPMKKTLAVFAVLTVLVGGILSIFASVYPDGLEWSLEKAAGTAEFEQKGPVYEAAETAVGKTAFMPDYGFAADEEGSALGTSLAGILGSAITVVLAGGIGLVIHVMRRKHAGESLS